MAITIAANLAKKLPLPGVDYASRSASITITAEVSDLGNISAEARRLYALAEAAVDQQLGITPMAQPTQKPPATINTPQPRIASPTSPSASQPYTNGRRAPAAISAAQLRFLRQLCDRTPGALDRICAEHEIGSLDGLSSRDASAVIDQLQSVTR